MYRIEFSDPHADLGGVVQTSKRTQVEEPASFSQGWRFCRICLQESHGNLTRKTPGARTIRLVRCASRIGRNKRRPRKRRASPNTQIQQDRYKKTDDLEPGKNGARFFSRYLRSIHVRAINMGCSSSLAQTHCAHHFRSDQSLRLASQSLTSFTVACIHSLLLLLHPQRLMSPYSSHAACRWELPPFPQPRPSAFASPSDLSCRGGGSPRVRAATCWSA